eukprot:CAMPEP_0194556964 /NCGR_PEP_ID=MMETSP0253-20130528/99004_1 /TAXON_ID=2966 /ORGANISM="Noctiluca scintillans" /LENGTH=46 /DNA_ID= /DNA_START= /DNA_END= /DNA_ORIENTATION=
MFKHEEARLVISNLRPLPDENLISGCLQRLASVHDFVEGLVVKFRG